MSVSVSRSVALVVLTSAIACATEDSDQSLSIDQEAAAISAMASSVPTLEGAAVQVVLLDRLDTQTTPSAPDTPAAPEAPSEGGSESPSLTSGTYTTEVMAVLSAPHTEDGIQVGEEVELHFEETAFEDQYTLDGFITVQQHGRQIIGYGAASFQSVEYDCRMEVWRDVSGTVDESGTLALTIESDTVVSGKQCEMSAFGEARWDVEDYLVVGSL